MTAIDERFKAFCEGIEPKQRYSQFGEDSVIEAIFARIGTVNKWCMECGAADGIFFSNTRKLIEEGWQALLIEADEKQFKKCGVRYLNNTAVVCYDYRVAASGAYSLDTLLAKAGAPIDIDLVVIDVDGQDYWLWNSLLKYRPRVVIVEYDPNTAPDFVPEISGAGQAGLGAILRLGYGKLYAPVCRTWCNVVFVRQDVAGLLMEDAPEKPDQDALDQNIIRIAAAMSSPRVGFLSNVDCVYAALAPFNVPLARGEGAFWHHSLSRSIQGGLDNGAEYILTIDYDTVFHSSDFAKLVCLLNDNPDVDVVVAMQQKREGGELLASSCGEVSLLDPLIPIKQGHFGLTLFRASVFERIGKPWFWEHANDAGEWGANRTDADIGFWQNCEQNNIVVRLATDVVIGHLELVATWPSPQLLPYYQIVSEWRQSGQVKPVEAFDRARLAASINPVHGNAPVAALEMKG